MFLFLQPRSNSTTLPFPASTFTSLPLTHHHQLKHSYLHKAHTPNPIDHVFSVAAERASTHSWVGLKLLLSRKAFRLLTDTLSRVYRTAPTTRTVSDKSFTVPIEWDETAVSCADCEWYVEWIQTVVHKSTDSRVPDKYFIQEWSKGRSGFKHDHLSDHSVRSIRNLIDRLYSIGYVWCCTNSHDLKFNANHELDLSVHEWCVGYRQWSTTQ
jgi:hypothetical protein